MQNVRLQKNPMNDAYSKLEKIPQPSYTTKVGYALLEFDDRLIDYV